MAPGRLPTLDVPERFNLGVACTDDQDPAARALTVVEPDRSRRDYTFGDVVDAANRLANALSELGIGRGDLVGIVSAASFETGVAFLALFRMGAIALPLSSLFGPDALASGCATRGERGGRCVGQRGRVREALDDGGDACRCW